MSQEGLPVSQFSYPMTNSSARSPIAIFVILSGCHYQLFQFDLTNKTFLPYPNKPEAGFQRRREPVAHLRIIASWQILAPLSQIVIITSPLSIHLT